MTLSVISSRGEQNVQEGDMGGEGDRGAKEELVREKETKKWEDVETHTKLHSVLQDTEEEGLQKNRHVHVHVSPGNMAWFIQ